jgi:hypothetical protein
VIRAALLVCAGLSAALLLAGCGGSGPGNTTAGPPLTKAPYEATVQEIVASVGAEYGHLSTDPTTISKGELAHVQRGLRELADRLADVSPPAEVQSLHAEYVDAMRSYADDLPGLTDELRSEKDPARALGLLLGSTSMQALLRISRELDERGYRFELGGG